MPKLIVKNIRALKPKFDAQTPEEAMEQILQILTDGMFAQGYEVIDAQTGKPLPIKNVIIETELVFDERNHLIDAKGYPNGVPGYHLLATRMFGKPATKETADGNFKHTFKFE